jgi:Protein of unknown function (DUF1523)
MRYVKWTFWGLVVLLTAAFLHYTLPQTDIVRIVGTNTQRVDIGANSWFFASPDPGTDTATANSRDVQFIQTILAGSGRPMVYRNQDTGWGWPPYFKVNSFDVQARASDLMSTEANPKWVAITHYGWRNQFFTIFPNAVGLRQVDSPEVTIIPWVNIVFFTVLALILFFIRRMWLQFRERTIDPALESMGETFDTLDERADAARANARTRWGRFRAWLGGSRR